MLKIIFKIPNLILLCLVGVLLTACQPGFDSFGEKHLKSIPPYLLKKMKTKGMTVASPVMLRIFKEENVMEVWKQDHTKRFAFLHSYEICKWAGKLGPKFKEGDRQAPEGFYHVTPALMNPNSDYHLSFNMGFPNTYDRANGRTGSFLMIHGACSSAGCYSMTDEYIEEIYAMAREAFSGGQKAFQIQAFPFRMTAENMAKNVDHPQFEFWKMLKEGSDHFEVTNLAPKVDVCEKRYVFNRYAEEDKKFSSRKECPPALISSRLALAFNKKQTTDEEVFDKILNTQSKNLFVKPEDKPKNLNASILANQTVGKLALLQPEVPKVDDAVQSAAASEISQTSPTPVEGPNPISAEVLGPTVSNAPANAAVPLKAKRQPAS